MKLTQSPWFLNSPKLAQPPSLHWSLLVGSAGWKTNVPAAYRLAGPPSTMKGNTPGVGAQRADPTNAIAPPPLSVVQAFSELPLGSPEP